MNTALAPSASALSTSLPRRTPPSMNTSARPRAASTISGRTSSEPGTASIWRPPWLDTQMPSTPQPMASSASSAVIVPLMMSGPFQRSRSHARSLSEAPGWASTELICSNSAAGLGPAASSLKLANAIGPPRT
jgi:hypothetical protein